MTVSAPNANGSLSKYWEYKERFAYVEGWLSDESIALYDFFLYNQSAKIFYDHFQTGDFLEIGIAYGKSALLMAMHADSKSVIRLLDASQSHLLGTAERVQAMTPNKVLGVFGYSEAVDPEQFPARSTRFMHIDGDHGRWALHNDLEMANRIVSADGMVVIDDFFSETFVGVTYGTIEWMALNPTAFEMILVGFNKAYLVRPRFARRYLEAIRDRLPAHMRACGLPNFTLLRTDDTRAFGCFGITGRQHDVDIVSREMATGLPEDLIDGKIRV